MEACHGILGPRLQDARRAGEALLPSPVTVPTEGEILRIKGVLILRRNATRDYLDFVALADRMGDAAVARTLLNTGSSFRSGTTGVR